MDPEYLDIKIGSGFSLYEALDLLFLIYFLNLFYFLVKHFKRPFIQMNFNLYCHKVINNELEKGTSDFKQVS